ncbi:unnamed protein product [Brassica rapa]|uniref:SHSP domain-containing protein n=1 Tax=Brassica campestris TaxID=3711 RepID=A0A8D9GMW1_BRACM|nr:unnamed protein product [Brassica rapa]
MAGTNQSCIFCQIIRNPTSTTLSFTPHYLIIPVEHIPTVGDLQRRDEDYSLGCCMLSVGKELLHKDAPQTLHRFGFHQPPFNSVDHLHLHCFALPFLPSRDTAGEDKASSFKAEGFLNPFLLNGPKGFDEFTPLAENDDTFVRLDLPGVPEECVRVGLSRSKKAVIVYGEAPKVHNHDSSSRKYLTIIKTICTCCDFVGFTYQMSDGVLRLVLSKTCTDPSSCISVLAFCYGESLSGDNTDDHAGKVYESKQLENGSLYVRLDMPGPALPGVPKDNFAVTVANGIVKVTGQAPSVSHDSAGRFYSGDVAMLSAPVNIPSRRIKTIAKNGVIRLLIPPL